MNFNQTQPLTGIGKIIKSQPGALFALGQGTSPVGNHMPQTTANATYTNNFNSNMAAQLQYK